MNFRTAAVPPGRINEIVLGKRSVSAYTAVHLAAALGTNERFWLGQQADYDFGLRVQIDGVRAMDTASGRNR